MSVASQYIETPRSPWWPSELQQKGDDTEHHLDADK